MLQANKIPRVCKICGTTGVYSYYGVIACESCKMFFKRNAENRKKILKCHYDGQCEVNIFNRHVCAACRLAKCFHAGMCTEMLRSSHAKRQKSSPLIVSTEITSRTNVPPTQISTLNLLEQDQSSLTTTQWTLLSNLINSYNEHSVLLVANNFMKELDSAHPKLRFKIDTTKVIHIITTLSQIVQPFIQSNGHYASLPLHHRSLMLRGIVDNVSCLNACFLLRQSELITNPAFHNALENTYGSLSYDLTLKIISLLDPDINVVKLALSIFTFCTSCCSVFDENIPLMYMRDTQSLFHIQNLYAELIWKYLLYRNTYEQTVRRFSYLVKCMVTIVSIRIQLQTVRNHTDFLQSLIEKIEQQQINVNDN